MPKKCKSCGGVFESIQRDGARYFHACAPVVSTVRVKRDGNPIDVAPRDVLPTDEELGRTYAERPNKRDENVKGAARAAAIIAEGAGVETV